MEASPTSLLRIVSRLNLCDINIYQPGRFLLVFQGASLWTTAVRKTRNLIGLCSAESLDTTKKSKKTHTHIWTPRKLLHFSRIFLLSNQTSDVQFAAKRTFLKWSLKHLNPYLLMDPLQSKRSQSTMWGYRTEVSTMCENSLTEKHAAAAHLSKTVPAGAKLRSNVVGESWNNEVNRIVNISQQYVHIGCPSCQWNPNMLLRTRSGLAINHVSKLARAARHEGKMMSIACNSLRDGPTKSNHGQTPMLQFLSFEDRNVLICFWKIWKKEWANPEISSSVQRQKFEVNSQLTHSQKLQGSTEPRPRLILRDSIWGWSKYIKICQNQWFTLIYRYLSYSRDEWRSINQLLTHSHNKTGMMWRTASNTFFWLKRCQKAPRVQHSQHTLHVNVTSPNPYSSNNLNYSLSWIVVATSKLRFCSTATVKQCCSW